MIEENKTERIFDS